MWALANLADGGDSQLQAKLITQNHAFEILLDVFKHTTNIPIDYLAHLSSFVGATARGILIENPQILPYYKPLLLAY